MNWDEISRKSEVKFEGIKKVVSVKNVVGYCRKICLGCRKCSMDDLKWKIVVREGKKGDRKVDLWGLECSVVGIRVINRYERK